MSGSSDISLRFEPSRSTPATFISRESSTSVYVLSAKSGTVQRFTPRHSPCPCVALDAGDEWGPLCVSQAGGKMSRIVRAMALQTETTQHNKTRACLCECLITSSFTPTHRRKMTVVSFRCCPLAAVT